MNTGDGDWMDLDAGKANLRTTSHVVGNPELAMVDNIDNVLWSCLPNGADADLLGDGCIRIATLNDLTAEWTGGIFQAAGTHFYVSVQHNVSGSGTVLDIAGWK